MDFVGGALPNVMLIAGLIAIGLGLGIQFNIVEVKGELSRAGRIGAVLVGMLLISVSVYLYTRPSQTAATGGVVPAAAIPTAGQNIATAMPAPTVAPAPTATPAAPAATAAPLVLVPDIRGQNAKDAEKTLAQAGLLLVASESDCATLGATRKEGRLKKDEIACQSPAPGISVPASSSVQYVLAGN
ncbi:MAG: hypothetical protein OHK0022_00860 [Roseiflexaceae bacterium]